MPYPGIIAPRAGMRMLGCVSTNSLRCASRVNPWVPAPSDSTTMVADEYSAYAAASRRRPGCSASLSPAPECQQGVWLFRSTTASDPVVQNHTYSHNVPVGTKPAWQVGVLWDGVLATPGTSRGTPALRYTPKMVPVGIDASMLRLPSSGSKTAT